MIDAFAIGFPVESTNKPLIIFSPSTEAILIIETSLKSCTTLFNVIAASLAVVVLSPSNLNWTFKPSLAMNSNKPASLVVTVVFEPSIETIISAFAIGSSMLSHKIPVIKPLPLTETILITDLSITFMIYSALAASNSSGISLNVTLTLYFPLNKTKSAVAVPFSSVTSEKISSPTVMVTLALAIDSPMKLVNCAVNLLANP